MLCRLIRRTIIATLATAAGGLLWTALSTDTAAQQRSHPPDLSSNHVGWIGIGDGFSAVPGAPGPGQVGDDPGYPYVPNNDPTGKQPTYRIGDVSNSNLKPWVRALMKKDNDEVLAGKIAFTPRSSCMPAGVPGFMAYLGGPVYFIQTPRRVLIIYASDQQVRRVYLNEPHAANPKASWYGESVGRYEGDTLVVDTVGMNERPSSTAIGRRTPRSYTWWSDGSSPMTARCWT
jgi:hypothetical protein